MVSDLVIVSVLVNMNVLFIVSALVIVSALIMGSDLALVSALVIVGALAVISAPSPQISILPRSRTCCVILSEPFLLLLCYPRLELVKMGESMFGSIPVTVSHTSIGWFVDFTKEGSCLGHLAGLQSSVRTRFLTLASNAGFFTCARRTKRGVSVLPPDAKPCLEEGVAIRGYL
jgi:prepilin signal peptidase PulO-like enzyme (type II secretory pathway)